MPRPASGNPHWEPFSVKLPPALLKQLRRHADLYRTSPATLIREGLEWRLNGVSTLPDAPQAALSPAAQVRLLQTLSSATTQLQQIMDMVGTMQQYYENTITTLTETLRTSGTLPKEYAGNTETGDTPESATDGRGYAENTGTEAPPPASLSAEYAGNTATAYAATVPLEMAITYDGNTASETPPFDETKYVLGKLCKRGHAHGTTGQSLLRKANLGCLQCDAEKARERRRQRQQR